MARQFAAPLPHGSLVEVLPDVFVVTGTFRLDPVGLITFPRNMTVLRRDGELSLVNSVRLSDAGERDLSRLGKVRHLIRLGAFHGLDDPYYLARYEPTFWLPTRTDLPPPAAAPPHQTLADGDRPGFLPGAEVLVFQNSRLTEAALRLPCVGGALVVCDSVGNFETTAGFSPVMRWLTPQKSLGRCTVASSTWLRRMRKGGSNSLEQDYRRLLALEFEALLPAHGSPLLSGAKQALGGSVDRMWPNAGAA